MKISAMRREPTGRPARSEKEKGLAPAEIRRLIESAAANVRLPGLGTAYGRMLLESAITPAQFAACQRWSELRASYEMALGVSGVRSQIGAMNSSGGEFPDPDSDLGVKISERDRRVMADYERAESVIRAVGTVEARDFRGICEGAEYAQYAEKGSVRKCADALVALWRIGGR